MLRGEGGCKPRTGGRQREVATPPATLGVDIDFPKTEERYSIDWPRFGKWPRAGVAIDVFGYPFIM